MRRRRRRCRGVAGVGAFAGVRAFAAKAYSSGAAPRLGRVSGARLAEPASRRGNSVVMPVMREVARIMLPRICAMIEAESTPMTLPLFA